MNTVKLADGNEIEFGTGDSLPPGATGQHTNVCRQWYRVGGGEWQSRGPMSGHKAHTLAEASATIEEFEAKLSAW